MRCIVQDRADDNYFIRKIYDELYAFDHIYRQFREIFKPIKFDRTPIKIETAAQTGAISRSACRRVIVALSLLFLAFLI